ncbi:MAG: VPDSG-CTERM sorting domain-containing protein [Verrucomicrobiota bacterium]|nr:VPDSG-CTERM sorting domain-containing protein [Verrucomicrobiota bacterium]
MKRILMKTQTFGKMAALGVVSIICLAASPAAWANLIQNGSFESPTLPFATISGTSPNNWTGGQYLISQGTFNFPNAEDGLQYEDPVNSNPGTLSQTIAITTAGNYVLTFWLNGYNGNSYGMNLFFPSHTGSYVGPLGAFYTGTGSSTWAVETFSFSFLTTGSLTLEFLPGSAAPNLIDNVDLELQPTAGVPDSGATAGLLGLGLAGLFALRRKFAWAA